MKDLKIRRCPVCGKIVWELEESAAVPFCCGRAMELIEANTDELTGEKHVPVSTLKDGMLTVRVGAVPHPSMQTHRIEWVALQCADRTGFRFLKKSEPCEVSFQAEGLTPEAVYAYCNVHGLWKGTVDINTD